jgi:hypothetical protein
MVTLPMERMASRVAASLAYASGLGPEMVSLLAYDAAVGTGRHCMPSWVT